MTTEFDERRKELLELNSKSWAGEYEFPLATKLDSSLKKNSTFIKKVKTGLNQEQYSNVLKDISSVSIEKYLSEVIVSLVEGLCKVSKNDEINAAVEVVSALHQRFGKQFTGHLLNEILVLLTNPSQAEVAEKEDSSRLSRQKNFMRLMGEFYIVGALHTGADFLDVLDSKVIKGFSLDKKRNEPLLTLLLKYLLNFELESGRSLSIVQSFLKRFGHIIFSDSELLPSDTRRVLKQIFYIYTEAVFGIMMKVKKQVQKLDVRNKKASIRTGRIQEEEQSELDEKIKLFEQFKNVATFLSHVCNLPLPDDLNDEVEEGHEKDASVEVVKSTASAEDDQSGIWEDLKEKNFYMVIPSLGELLEAHPESLEHKSAQSHKDGEKIQEFLDRLKDVRGNNLEQLVVEFNNLNLNNKATKNRIMRFFIETSTVNNLKYYTRFLKINELNLSELIEELITYLDKGFRSQIHRNKLNVKNILFFVELIKFKMIPKHVVFHKIRSLTLNITSTNNIEILTVFYEHVGRFLLHDPDSKELMREMIDLLREKSKQSNLNVNDKLAINNLLITVEPPVTKVQTFRTGPELSPKQIFIQKIFREELNPGTRSLVVKRFRAKFCQLGNAEYKTMLDCFSKPHLVNYDNIPTLARILSAFGEKNESLVVCSVDTVLEDIIRGLELNDFRMNRTRMAQVKYLSELYNSKVINFRLINDMLYRIVCYGHPQNRPLPENWDVEIDLPNNYFRVQMCCLLLLSLRSIFVDTDVGKRKSPTRAASIKKRNDINKDLLGVFMTFFQYYMYCKESPFPVDVRFKLDDLFKKYKSIATVKRYDTIQEVLTSLGGAMQKRKEAESLLLEEEEEDEVAEIEANKTAISANVSSDEDSGADDDDNDDYDDDDDDGGEAEGDFDEDDEDESDAEESDGDGDSDDEDSGESEEEEEEEEEDDDDDEDLSRVPSSENNISEAERARIEAEQKFQEDLDREFQKIMIESYGSSQQQQLSSSLQSQLSATQSTKAPSFRQSLPLPSQLRLSERSTGGGATKHGTVAFGLLTKNGKNQKIKQLNLPSDNVFAESVVREQENRKRDKERIMNLASRMDG
ncbi:NMD2 [Candida theae]|uniref:NMD2 n=1 Tax=Candida theae TaxID=1198502 RepID=A0AAD5BEH7_9ASCO|nr:NMD2 [Candida theae]KAI5957665.1 NMD2 [Candida theae]